MLYSHLYIKHRIVLSYTLTNTSYKRTCITNNNSSLFVNNFTDIWKKNLLFF